jgi:hypothetical protein
MLQESLLLCVLIKKKKQTTVANCRLEQATSSQLQPIHSNSLPFKRESKVTYSVSVYGHLHAIVWRSKDSLWELVLFSQHVGSRNGTRAVRLVSKHRCYSVSHLFNVVIPRFKPANIYLPSQCVWLTCSASLLRRTGCGKHAYSPSRGKWVFVSSRPAGLQGYAVETSVSIKTNKQTPSPLGCLIGTLKSTYPKIAQDSSLTAEARSTTRPAESSSASLLIALSSKPLCK